MNRPAVNNGHWRLPLSLLAAVVALWSFAGFSQNIPVYPPLSGPDGDPTESVEEPIGFVLLKPVTVSPSRYTDPAFAKQYRTTRYHVLKVYPYAREALTRIAELDSVAREAEKRKELRRYRKQLEDELKAEFKEDLKNLTRTQGKILISILERQTEQPFFDLLRDWKSGVTATFWQALGKTYGYNLKDGYDPSDDPVLESILAGLEWPDVPKGGQSRYR